MNMWGYTWKDVEAVGLGFLLWIVDAAVTYFLDKYVIPWLKGLPDYSIILWGPAMLAVIVVIALIVGIGLVLMIWGATQDGNKILGD
jgi:hypothetical protein